MTDNILMTIINELGPTGLLICGLYWILGRHAEKISKHIEIINHELKDIHDTIKECAKELCKKSNGTS
jgi:hypothetical protein